MENSYFGARVNDQGHCSFRIFAPDVKQVEISVLNGSVDSHIMIPSMFGFHEITLAGVGGGTIYSYTLDGMTDVPDPASLCQPEGLLNASMVVDHHYFDWRGDGFSGLPINEMLIYEIHVGAFSPEMNFGGIINRLDHFSDLGINTLQLMPVSQFAGHRSWGYNTVFPYAVHHSYGKPDDFKELVRQCHLRGIAVVIDVSFGGLHPVNELTAFYPSFLSKKYNLKNGNAVNFDERFSSGVREFYIQCALSWLRDYHVDGLRISDSQNVFDQTPLHFLEELSLRVKEFSAGNDRHCVLITGDKRNSMRPVLPVDKGGYGLDALYNDDFHNALLSRVTGETKGVLNDFSSPERMVSALQYGFSYRGELSPHHMRLQGRCNSELQGCKLVVFSQGHDHEEGMEKKGRIIDKAGFEAAKLSAGVTLLSPYIPMIFMGEEYGETAPFLYFNDACEHGYDQNSGIPCPKDKATFASCCLDWRTMGSDKGRAMLALYRRLIEVRKEHPTIQEPCRSRCQAQEIAPGLVLLFRNCASANRNYAAILFNFSREKTDCSPSRFLPEGVWTTHLYSASKQYGGSDDPLPGILPGFESINMAPQSFALFFYSELRNKF